MQETFEDWRWSTRRSLSSDDEYKDKDFQVEQKCSSDNGNSMHDSRETIERKKSGNLTNLLDAATLCDVFESTADQNSGDRNSRSESLKQHPDASLSSTNDTSEIGTRKMLVDTDGKNNYNIDYNVSSSLLTSWVLTQHFEDQSSLFRDSHEPPVRSLNSSLFSLSDGARNDEICDESRVAAEIQTDEALKRTASQNLTKFTNYDMPTGYSIESQKPAKGHPPQILQYHHATTKADTSSGSPSENDTAILHNELIKSENNLMTSSDKTPLFAEAAAIESETQFHQPIQQDQYIHTRRPSTNIRNASHSTSSSVIDTWSSHSSTRSSIATTSDGEYSDSDCASTDEVRIVSLRQRQRRLERTDSSSSTRASINATADVGQPSKFDVLCGQSQLYSKHSGNRRFQVILQMYAPKYENARNKQEKMNLTKEIVACIHSSGGRFLKRKKSRKGSDSKSKQNTGDGSVGSGDDDWQEIPNVRARDKVSHALRTKMASSSST